MSVFRPADAGRTLLISEADLSGEAIERGVELRVVEAVVHLREAAAQADDILRDVLAAQDAVCHQGSQLVELRRAEAEARHLADAHAQRAAGGEALFLRRG